MSAELPRIEVVHDLPEAEKVYAHDGTPLERIGEESSEQLDFKPAQVRVIRNVRPKYACPCCREGVRIAPVPPAFFPKSLATPALLAHITTAKFVDGLPLHRQEAQFARLGVGLGRATMAGWMIRLGATHIVPFINLLNERMFEHPLIHCDETRLLEGYRGRLLTDGYEAYAGVAQALGLVHAGCLAHARRRFDEARKAQPDTATHAKTALAFIRELYLIERALWDRARPVTPAERVTVRQQHSAPIVARFHAWLEALAPRVLPEGGLGKAVHYALGQWPKLTVFLRDGEVRWTITGVKTRSARSWSVVKAGSSPTRSMARRRARTSLVETAKANQLEPHAYLSLIFARLPTLTSVEDYAALLPWNVKTEFASSTTSPRERQNAVA